MSAYLDYNATAPLRPEAAEIMTRLLAETGNGSSVHGAGRRARAHVETAREQVAGALGAAPAGVVFTSGGTEANNLAIKGAGRKRLLVSAIEHPSVLEAAPGAEIIPADGDGVVDLAALETLLAENDAPALVSVMLANNETGVVQPVAAAAEIVRRHGALLHTDAVQAAGKLPVDMAWLGADMMTVSSHKLGGPQGVGALIVRDGLDIEPQIRGGGQERGHRAGTENVPGIAAFGAALDAACTSMACYDAIEELRDDMELRIGAAAPEAVFFGARAERLPNTLCFGVRGLPSETQVISLDLAGVMVSAGSACSSGKVEPSHVLTAMGAPDDLAQSSIRVSLGWDSTEDDVRAFVSAWSELHGRTRGGAAAQASAA